VTTSGFSSRRLARVRDVLSRHVEAGYVPGAVAVVARHGEVHIEATGTVAFEGDDSGAPAPPGLPILFDFWTAAYQAIDD